MRLATLLPHVASSVVLIQGIPILKSSLSTTTSGTIDSEFLSFDTSIESTTTTSFPQRDTIEPETGQISKDDELKGDELKGHKLKPHSTRSPPLSVTKRACNLTKENSTIHNISHSSSYCTTVMEMLETLPLEIYLLAILPWWLMFCVRLADRAHCFRQYSEDRLQEIKHWKNPLRTEHGKDEDIPTSRFDLTLALAIPFGWPLFIWDLAVSNNMYEQALEATDVNTDGQHQSWLEEQEPQEGEREALLAKQPRGHYCLRMVRRQGGQSAGWNGLFTSTQSFKLTRDTDLDDDDFRRSYAFGVGMMPSHAPLANPLGSIFDEGSEFSPYLEAQSSCGTRSSRISPLTL